MTNFSTQKERILQFIESKGISKNKFYIETGISNGVLDKKSGLSMDTVEKFYSKYPEINPEWILTGKGDMLKEDENPNIEHVLGFGEEQKRELFNSFGYTSSGDEQLQYMVEKLSKFNEMLEKENTLQANLINDKDKIISMQEKEIERLTKENILLNDELGRSTQTKRSAG